MEKRIRRLIYFLILCSIALTINAVITINGYSPFANPIRGSGYVTGKYLNDLDRLLGHLDNDEEILVRAAISMVIVYRREMSHAHEFKN